MPSRNESPIPDWSNGAGQAPKRRRGHRRVAAIMAAGIELFAEKGYDATTMTEIAARSGAAIASLYRFFPSKEALADALLMQYLQSVAAGLAELKGRVAGMTPQAVAGELVALRLGFQAQRRYAIELADARGGSEARRAVFRKTMVDGMAALLREAVPGLGQARSTAMAGALLHVLKGVSAVDREKPMARRAQLVEFERLIGAYLAAALPVE